MPPKQTWLFLFLLTGSASVMADHHVEGVDGKPAYLPQFEFQFEQKEWREDTDSREFITPEFKSLSDTTTQIDQLDARIPVSYTHLTLPTRCHRCRSRWSPDH